MKLRNEPLRINPRGSIPFKRNRPVVISFGDPCGIGPEVIVKALRQIKNEVKFIIIGDYDVYKKYGGITKNISFINVFSREKFKNRIGRFSRHSGSASLEYLNKAIKLIRLHEARALVTAPLSKEAVALSYPQFHGHTEYLAHAFKVKDVEMMFVAPDLKTVIATRHIPLSDVPAQLSSAKVLKTIQLTQRTLKRLFKIKNPRIGVCGVNPHAGEGGLLGKEDKAKLVPAINRARKQGMNVLGPLSADTAFTKKSRSSYDVLIAMYHDQGLAPIKALYFDKLVNLTIGLPFIRTSPAHGTAFDIAGKNKADPTSMVEAIRLAMRLSS